MSNTQKKIRRKLQQFRVDYTNKKIGASVHYSSIGRASTAVRKIEAAGQPCRLIDLREGYEKRIA